MMILSRLRDTVDKVGENNSVVLRRLEDMSTKFSLLDYRPRTFFTVEKFDRILR